MTFLGWAFLGVSRAVRTSWTSGALLTSGTGPFQKTNRNDTLQILGVRQVSTASADAMGHQQARATYMVRSLS
jgi:hypothetical protein